MAEDKKVIRFHLTTGQVVLAEVDSEKKMTNPQIQMMTERGPTLAPFARADKQYPVFQDVHIILQYEVERTEADNFREFLVQQRADRSNIILNRGHMQ